MALENKYDRQFKVVFDAIRSLMKKPEPKHRGIGFTALEDAARNSMAFLHKLNRPLR